MCCYDTGKAVDKICGPNRGFLVSHGNYPGVTEPTTPTRGLTIHPRVKKPIGRRLAQSSWSLVYGHSEVPWTGPVLSGCSEQGSGSKRVLHITFNSSLLGQDQVSLSNYSREERASVTWVLMNTHGTRIPKDAEHNFHYENRQSWWGDDADWVYVNIEKGDTPNSIIAHLPSDGEVLAVKYGHGSPRRQPQNGHLKICCGDRNFNLDPCPPESCPLSSGGLPAMPFMARVSNGKCQCLAPQVCDETSFAEQLV